MLDKIQFLKLNQAIKLNKPLSDQFYSKFSNGIIPIDTQVEFVFEENTFVDPENSKIIYEALIDGK